VCAWLLDTERNAVDLEEVVVRLFARLAACDWTRDVISAQRLLGIDLSDGASSSIVMRVVTATGVECARGATTSTKAILCRAIAAANAVVSAATVDWPALFVPVVARARLAIECVLTASNAHSYAVWQPAVVARLLALAQ
jgi:hypothetical protein